MAFGPDGQLYVTTQGSVADGIGGISYLFASQILTYDVETGLSSVFAEPAAGSKGFTSMLGLEFTPECGIRAFHPDCFLYASDFAGQIIKFTTDTDAEPVTLSTDYPAPSGGNFVGGVTIGRGNVLYSVGFKDVAGSPTGVPGAILRYKYKKSQGDEPYLFAGGTDDEVNLVRPIGVLALPRPSKPGLFKRLFELVFSFCI